MGSSTLFLILNVYQQHIYLMGMTVNHISPQLSQSLLIPWNKGFKMAKWWLQPPLQWTTFLCPGRKKKNSCLVQGKVSKWVVRCISVTDRIIKMSSPTKISSPSYSTDINLGNSVETLVMSNQITSIWHYLGLLGGFNVFIWIFKNRRRRQKGHSNRCRGEMKHKAPEVKETEI